MAHSSEHRCQIEIHVYAFAPVATAVVVAFIVITTLNIATVDVLVCVVFFSVAT